MISGWTRLRRRFATLSIDVVHRQSPATGLVHIQVRGDSPGSADARLRLFVDNDCIFEAPLHAQEAGADRLLLDLGLHSALLTDGEHELRVELHERWRSKASAHTSLHIRNCSPIAQRSRAALTAAGTPLVVHNGDFDSSLYPYSSTGAGCWFDSPDALEYIATGEAEGRFTADEAARLRHFVEHGYLVLEGLIAPDILATVNAEIDSAVASGWEAYRYGSSQRITQLHSHYPGIRALWQSERYLHWLRLLFGEDALPCQSLTYLFGSQQDAHQDTIHLTPFPAGAMCGVWIALEDIQPDSGELVIYPGSHRLERLYLRDTGCAKVRDNNWQPFGEMVVPRWQELITRHGLRPEIYRPAAGSVLIWHENLLHAGSRREDPDRTRRSIVFHCFAEGAVPYYDSTGQIGYTFRPDSRTTRP